MSTDDGFEISSYDLRDEEPTAQRLGQISGVTSFRLEAFSPDSAYAVFSAWPTGMKMQLFVLDVVSGGLEQITDTIAGESAYFRLFSDDGRSLYYTTNDRPGGYGEIEVFRINLDGTEDQMVTIHENEDIFLPRADLPRTNEVLVSESIKDTVRTNLTAFSLITGAGRILNETDRPGASAHYEAMSKDQRFILYRSSVEDFVPRSEFNDADLYLVSVDDPTHRIQLTRNDSHTYFYYLNL